MRNNVNQESFSRQIKKRHYNVLPLLKISHEVTPNDQTSVFWSYFRFSPAATLSCSSAIHFTGIFSCGSATAQLLATAHLLATGLTFYMSYFCKQHAFNKKIKLIAIIEINYINALYLHTEIAMHICKMFDRCNIEVRLHN